VSDFLTLLVRHHTGFQYDGLAMASYNEARMTPLTTANQKVRQSHVRVSPTVPLGTYRDYFGTEVVTFELHEPHAQLEVEALSTVESRAASLSPPLQWGDLEHQSFTGFFSEYLHETNRSAMARDVVDELRGQVRAVDIHEGVEVVAAYVRWAMKYLPGATSVSSTAMEAWQRRAGVCQDMTHVTIGVLRQLGIPARYVSGYLYPKLEVPTGEATAGESHAWVEYYAGEWTGIDPTNGFLETERHIIVGRGRDYDDVPPLKGIYEGPPSSNLGVIVEMTVVDE
jgi:transglutaminase-like putative cysteine protease